MLLRVLLVALSYCGQSLTLPPDAFTVPLDADELHTLYWTVDYDAQTVSLEAHFRVPADNWVALGFSDYGEITDADLCVLRAGQDGARLVEDSWTDKYGVLHRDQSQDCEGEGFEMADNLKKVLFTRKFDTADQHDYIIEEGTTHVVWASGSGPLVKLDGLNIASAQHGFQRTDLLKNLPKTPLPPDTFTISLISENIKVPTILTPIFWNDVIKLPDIFNQKHHIVKFEPILPSGDLKSYIHHIKLYYCTTKPDEVMPFYFGLRSYRPHELETCRTTMAIWGPGGSAMYFPEEVGMPVGGPDLNLYVMLETHLGNPKMGDNLVITSGLRLFVTPTLREYDAGVVKLAAHIVGIPPGQPHFAINGHCSSACTNESLPVDGITIFGTWLHTHAYGNRIVMRHVRDGQMLPDIDRDNHHSSHYQEPRLLKRPVHVKPGDSLISTCVYNTTGLSTVTIENVSNRPGGEACVIYTYYYPRTNLIYCTNKPNGSKQFSSYKLGDEPEPYDSTEAIDDAFILMMMSVLTIQMFPESQYTITVTPFFSPLLALSKKKEQSVLIIDYNWK